MKSKNYVDYTEQENIFLKNNYNSKTNKELAKVLNKTIGSVSYQARKLGLIKQPHRYWTEEENNFLRENYNILSAEEIGKKLNRTRTSIFAQADVLKIKKEPSWTEDEENFLIDNFEHMTHSQIGKVLGRSQGAITAKCFDMDLYKKERPWSKEDEDFLRLYHQEISTKELSELLNRTTNGVIIHARRLGLKKFPYYCNYHFFDKIDTEEKAYWLGFLTADGYISKNDETGSGMMGVELQYSDINHLKKLNKCLEGNYQITDRWRPCTLSTKDKEKKNHICVLRVFSKIMYDSLFKIGFTNNKTFDAYIPDIPLHLINHYVRGYFDGDGCFTYTSKSFGVNFVTASKNLYENLKEVLSLNNIAYTISIRPNECNTTMFYIYINKHNDKIKFLKWIYEDSNIYLDRKHDKYLKVIENEHSKSA